MKPKIASTKTNRKKLQLAKETLRSLNDTELGQVAGGSANQVFNGSGAALGDSVAVRCGLPGLDNGSQASMTNPDHCLPIVVFGPRTYAYGG
jgi:hypothetical protein